MKRKRADADDGLENHSIDVTTFSQDILIAIGVTSDISTLFVNAESIHETLNKLRDLCSRERVDREQFTPITTAILEHILARNVGDLSIYLNALYVCALIDNVSLFSEFESVISTLTAGAHMSQTLQAALISHNPDILSNMFDNGVDVETMECGEYLLHMAVAARNGAAVQVILDYGADLNYSDMTQLGPDPLDTPLLIAINYNYEDMIQLLLDNKANVNFNKAQLPLHKAAEQGKTHIVQLLLEAKAKVNATFDEEGKTALMMAVQNGHDDIMQLLIAHKAKIDMKTDVNVSALTIAVMSNKPAVAAQLINLGANVNIAALFTGRTLLMTSVRRGYHQCVKLLIDAKAKIDVVDKYDYTALMCAFEDQYKPPTPSTAQDSNESDTTTGSVDSLECVKLLIKAKANLNFNNNVRRNPVMLACESNHVPALQYMIEKKASLSRHKEGNLTPLIAACSAGSASVVEYLLQQQVAININEDSSYGPAIHCAVVGDQAECVQHLIDAGAYVTVNPKTKVDPKKCRQWPHSMLMIAALNGFDKVVKALCTITEKNFHPYDNIDDVQFL